MTILINLNDENTYFSRDGAVLVSVATSPPLKWKEFTCLLLQKLNNVH